MLKILLVGCGRMGEALANGWLNQGHDPAGIWVVEPNQKSAGVVGSKPARVVRKIPVVFAPWGHPLLRFLSVLGALSAMAGATRAMGLKQIKQECQLNRRLRARGEVCVPKSCGSYA